MSINQSLLVTAIVGGLLHTLPAMAIQPSAEFMLAGSNDPVRPAAPRAAPPIAGATIGVTADDNDGDGGNDGLMQRLKKRYGAIVDNGGDSLYLAGYAHHGRDTYTREKLDELNEKSWGAGYGKTLRNAAGNDESLYMMAISDSHKQAQLMAGYAYEWIWPLRGTGLEAGLGYTAMLVSRSDYFGRTPFPIALPLASIGVPKAKLMASYVPRLSANKGNGDVLFMFMRIELN